MRLAETHAAMPHCRRVSRSRNPFSMRWRAASRPFRPSGNGAAWVLYCGPLPSSFRSIGSSEHEVGRLRLSSGELTAIATALRVLKRNGREGRILRDASGGRYELRAAKILYRADG